MSVDVKERIFIQRPRKDVANVMFNPKCDRVWITFISKSFPLDSGILKKGDRVQHIGEFMKRAFSSMIFVTKDIPNQMVEMTSDEPFPMRVRYQLEDANEGTVASVQIQSFGEILINAPSSILSKAISEKLTAELKKLKKHCEEPLD
jgi:hypothetical protein